MEKRRKWAENVHKYRSLIYRCGVPLQIVEDERRFVHFLYHGYDGEFRMGVLTQDQFDHLYEFVYVQLGWEEMRLYFEMFWASREWSRFLYFHRDIVKDFGIPPEIMQDRKKFFDLIRGGLNKVTKSNFGLFMLTSEQRRNLVVFLRDGLKMDESDWAPLVPKED